MGKSPKALVFGAKGRCGKGSVDAFKACGVDVLEWDMEETKKGGPFQVCVSLCACVCVCVCVCACLSLCVCVCVCCM